MIENLPRSSASRLGFKLSGKLHDADYKTFVPTIDSAIQSQGKVRILAWFHEFQGWDAKALWDDIKFSTTHCSKVDRIALVGEKAWEKWMSVVCKPFTLATIQYFDASQIEDAWKWLEA
jgi:universal stress protein A